jgi:hypothetical protein
MGEKILQTELCLVKVKRLLERPRQRREDNIEANLKEVEWESMDWINMAWEKRQVTSSCENGSEHSGSIKCGDSFY